MAQSRLILVSSAAWALGFVVGLGGVVVGCGNSGNNADAGSGVGGATGTGGGSVTGTGGSSTTGTGGAASGVGGVSGTAGSTGTAGATGTGGRGTGGAPADAGARPDTGGTAMSFFVTSTGSGTMGGNLGGVAAADTKCQTLAAAVGQGGRTWHAYLSTSAAPPVHARMRIGNGPWYNARGTMIAASVAQLHDEGGMNALSAANSLDENGAMIPTNQHDMLTGSTVAGMAFPATPDRTCADWTSNAATGVTAQVGHCNRAGGGDIPTSWNSAHAPACNQATMMQMGGAGRFYCFAIN